MTANHKFRDYATRVSFNLSLTRNQIASLAYIVTDIENEGAEWNAGKRSAYQVRMELLAGAPDMYVTAVRIIERMGLIEHRPEWLADRDRCDALKAQGKTAIAAYWGPSFRLTAAGEHVVALLRLAGLLPQAAANTNKAKKRKRA